MHVTHVQRRDPAPAEPRPSRGTGDDIGADPDRVSANGPPRWLSVFGIVVAVALVLLFFVLHLTGVLGPGAH
jgi:hypothetical protein